MLGITNDLHWVPYSNPLKDTKTDTFKENGTLMKDKLKSMFNDIHGVHIHQSSVLPSWEHDQFNADEEVTKDCSKGGIVQTTTASFYS